jgi:hypothetical protein
MYFLWHYERPAIKIQPNRGLQAEEWFNTLIGTTPKKKKSKVYMYIRKRRKII